jgi:predicted lipid-binding transport protein (Tim44 family)
MTSAEPSAVTIVGKCRKGVSSMSEEFSNTTPAKPANAEETAARDPLEERRAQRAERRAHRHDAAPWLGGVILIVLGLIFLAQNFGVATLNNWWALFILIPAGGAFSAAWRKYQAAGESLTSDVLGSLMGGLILTAVSLIFLFNLNLGANGNLLWPILLILGGVAVLLQARLR